MPNQPMPCKTHHECPRLALEVTCPVGFAALAVMCHRFFGVEERGKAKKVIANLLPGLEATLAVTPETDDACVTKTDEGDI